MNIHFIGVGGIGVSALANYFLKKGYTVTGSDISSSEITEALERDGAKIYIGPHNSKNVASNVDEVIYSPAIKLDNPEIVEAINKKIKNHSYPEALGELTKQYFTIAVSGTHGKSTTTAMISLILVNAGLDPTVIIGTKLREFQNSNCRVGKSKYLVIEADEWNASFLKYFPKIIVLTNIEREHLDFYKNLKNILKTFKEYISHLPKEGILIANRDDSNILKLLELKPNLKLPKLKLLNQKNVNTTFSTIVKNVVFYSIKQNEAKKISGLLKIPGEHNVSNALAALAVARILKIPDKISLKTLSNYKGAWRRLETKSLILNEKKITVINDYAHHPTEIKVTLTAIRKKYPKKKIWCIYQPHQYQRTYYLFDEFVKTFKKLPIDKVIITDIYDVVGRENQKIKVKINSLKLVNKINKKSIIYLPKKEILNYLKKSVSEFEILVVMGAGDIYLLL
jgi:UDP-N-acetylmuramate--alanine ligase